MFAFVLQSPRFARIQYRKAVINSLAADNRRQPICYRNRVEHCRLSAVGSSRLTVAELGAPQGWKTPGSTGVGSWKGGTDSVERGMDTSAEDSMQSSMMWVLDSSRDSRSSAGNQPMTDILLAAVKAAY